MKGKKMPTQMKLITGNAGKRPIDPNEVKPGDDIRDCPEHLSDDAKEEWAYMHDQLKQLGLLKTVDVNALAQYCQAYSDWKAAVTFTNQNGFTYSSETRNGLQIKEYPQVKIAESRFAIMYRLSAKFGFTPVDRVGLVGEKTPDDDLGAFIKKKA